MSNYLVWHQHEEVQHPVAGESNENDDEDQMDDMIDDIGRGYDLGSVDSTSDVQNFYILLVASEEKVYGDTDVIVLQTVTHLMVMKSKYNFSDQCYNDIVKLRNIEATWPWHGVGPAGPYVRR
jgi:hypothetical protein